MPNTLGAAAPSRTVRWKFWKLRSLVTQPRAPRAHGEERPDPRESAYVFRPVIRFDTEICGTHALTAAAVAAAQAKLPRLVHYFGLSSRGYIQLSQSVLHIHTRTQTRARAKVTRANATHHFSPNYYVTVRVISNNFRTPRNTFSRTHRYLKNYI